MSAGDAPLSPAELRRWVDTVATMRECDTLSGLLPAKDTGAATEALGRALQAQRGTA